MFSFSAAHQIHNIIHAVSPQPDDTTTRSMISYLTDGGPVVLFVLVVLLGMSFVSWLLIVTKWVELRKAVRDTDGFLHAFDKAGSFTEAGVAAQTYSQTPLAEMYLAARKELDARNQKGGGITSDFTPNVERAMERKARHGIARLEHRLGFLATVASASPFIGLFGTVWGIMEAFGNIQENTAVLTAVAPHIAHALIATAVGLAAAIPAVMAYNNFVGKVRLVSVELDGFADDLMTRLGRSATLEADPGTGAVAARVDMRDTDVITKGAI
jgi:biopolymer transport protein TolQ